MKIELTRESVYAICEHQPKKTSKSGPSSVDGVPIVCAGWERHRPDCASSLIIGVRCKDSTMYALTTLMYASEGVLLLFFLFTGVPMMDQH